jgi:hypothetical protein
VAQNIQRVPRGLADLLSLAGGNSPSRLADEVVPQLDLLQLYGMTQLQTRTSTDPAVVQGSGTGVTLSASSWSILFGADVGVTQAAAMTALSLGLIIRRGTPGFTGIATKDHLGAFSAGGFSTLAWRAPYPLVCPPGTVVFGGIDKLAGVANAALTFTVEFGILG